MQPSRFWSTSCFALLPSFMEMLISFSSRTLSPAHTAKTTSFADHDIIVIDWPANIPDLKPIWNRWDIFNEKQWIQQSRRAEDSIVPQQCHRPIASTPHVTDAEGAPTRCRNQHTLKNLNLSVFFYLRKYSNILRYCIFEFHDLQALTIKIKTKKTVEIFYFTCNESKIYES